MNPTNSGRLFSLQDFTIINFKTFSLFFTKLYEMSYSWAKTMLYSWFLYCKNKTRLNHYTKTSEVPAYGRKLWFKNPPYVKIFQMRPYRVSTTSGYHFGQKKTSVLVRPKVRINWISYSLLSHDNQASNTPRSCKRFPRGNGQYQVLGFEHATPSTEVSHSTIMLFPFAKWDLNC